MEIRREADNELCGYVDEGDGGWRALTVFGAELGVRSTMLDAARVVSAEGLRSLAEHWLLTGDEIDGEELVCIQNVSPAEVTVALGHHSLPGVPTLTLTRADLDAGRWNLRRQE